MSPSVLTQVSLAVRQYHIKNAFVMSVIEPEHKLIKIRLRSPYLELLGDGSWYDFAEYALLDEFCTDACMPKAEVLRYS